MSPDCNCKLATVPHFHVLQTGKLGLAASEELRRRVKAGEDEAKVRAELLLREGKGVRG